ncbi:peroxidase family protein [Marinicella litoralis]|uniref:Heme peroxidase n=1 Tax=Marinicella litoralis TaxID=644220 RepID=A0A4V3DI51_9GAMM|nr:peroxidase family protein [Marinicella litoralis]TDR20771.1 heme peroxidase [Marinicella litoralis]
MTLIKMACYLSIFTSSHNVLAQNPPQNGDGQNDGGLSGNSNGNGPIQQTQNSISPARRIIRGPKPPQNNPPSSERYRSIDGSGNHHVIDDMGQAHTQLIRLVDNDYTDGISQLSGTLRANARTISNAISAQAELMPNNRNATDFVWQWGQFLDHDIDLTDGVDPAEPIDIQIPTGDAYFDPSSSGHAIMSVNRSIYDPASGTDISNPRQQINEISAWIDASNVYGSDSARANELRTLDGSGQLKTSAGGFLPFNVNGFPNAGGDSEALFLAGDVRVNEQIGLTTLHTLFMREHNWQARRIKNQSPNLSGDQVYEEARAIVGAEMQAITYFEYLPALLGRNALPPYRGYDDRVHAGISNLFSGAVFRYGHSALSPQLLRLNANGKSIEQGSLPLRNAFFSPYRLATEGGIEPLLRGLATQVCQSVDNFIIDDVRNFLFGAPGAGGFDLASINIQRGRDHGLPSYNEVRAAYGLPLKKSFAEITSDVDKQNALASVYPSVDDIDLWVGGLSENIEPGALVGQLIRTVLIEQFSALRDGDRFYFENQMTRQQVDQIRRTRLSDIIRRNTDIGFEIQDNVFFAVQAL